MSGLNVSLGYLLAVLILSVCGGIVLRLRPIQGFSTEFPASFLLVACWLEVQTLAEVGQWAGGFGPDVTATVLFLVLVIHGIVSRGATGNPTFTWIKFLQRDATFLPTLSGVVGQFLGAFLAQLLTAYYWSLELTDMHTLKNMMNRECSPALRVSLFQGVFTEAACALIVHLLHFCLRRTPALLNVPLTALTLTSLSFAANGHTSGFLNPSLAYALTFHCPGVTLTQYATVYWLGPLAGTTLALFLHTGHIPRFFARNLLYSQKTRFRVPKSKTMDGKKKSGKKGN